MERTRTTGGRALWRNHHPSTANFRTSAQSLVGVYLTFDEIRRRGGLLVVGNVIVSAQEEPSQLVLELQADTVL